MGHTNVNRDCRFAIKSCQSGGCECTSRNGHSSEGVPISRHCQETCESRQFHDELSFYQQSGFRVGSQSERVSLHNEFPAFTPFQTKRSLEPYFEDDCPFCPPERCDRTNQSNGIGGFSSKFLLFAPQGQAFHVGSRTSPAHSYSHEYFSRHRKTVDRSDVCDSPPARWLDLWSANQPCLVNCRRRFAN